MADVTINGLSAGMISGTDEIEYQITGGGASRKTTAGAIAALAGALTNPMTSVGDIIRGGTSGAPTRLAIGTTGQVLTVAAGIPSWATPTTGVTLANTSPWTKNQYVTPVSVASATGTYTPDASASNNFQLTLTGNLTLANPANLQTGMVLNFCLDEDATGGRTITLGSLYKWPGGTVPTWVTTASAKNFFSAYYDGAILRCSGGVGYA